MSDRKGILLAGGRGTRLGPATKGVSKHLLPVFDKPMIYYSLSVLMLSGIREILIISTGEDLPNYRRALGDGRQLGLRFSYEMQDEPRGVAEAFVIGRDFVGTGPVALILGDNFFYGRGLAGILNAEARRTDGATIFGYHVDRPENYGVIELSSDGQCLGLEEKPVRPKSNWVATGLYFYDNDVLDIAADLLPSARDELEITDVNKQYLAAGKLTVRLLGRGLAWLDTGTPGDLLNAAQFVSSVQQRQGRYISSIEEIAFSLGYISRDDLVRLAEPMKDTDYGRYLLEIGGSAVELPSNVHLLTR